MSAFLRAFVLGIGSLLSAGGIVIMLVAPRAWPAALELIILGCMVLVFTVFERWRYRRNVNRPSPGFRETSERFIEPTSGKQIVVDYNAETGEREYREASDGKSAGSSNT